MCSVHNMAITPLQDRDDDGPEPVAPVPGRHGILHPGQEDRGRRDPQGGGPHVDLLPVYDQRGPPQDPHRDAHHHL